MGRKKKSKNSQNSPHKSSLYNEQSSTSHNDMDNDNRDRDENGNDNDNDGGMNSSGLGGRIRNRTKALVLTVHREPTNKRGKNIKEENERVLRINEVDANRLNVTNGDSVIVTEVNYKSIDDKSIIYKGGEGEKPSDSQVQIIWDHNTRNNTTDKKEPKFISVCKVNVVKSMKKYNKKNTAFSPKSPNANAKNQITQGEAKVSPIQLSQRIFDINTTVSKPLLSERENL